MNTKLKQMEKQRELLNAEIRKAKRAEAKRRRAELLAARQQLGLWLSETTGADTPEAVARLREALDTDQVREFLAKQLVVDPSTADAQNDDAHASETPYIESASRDEYGSHHAYAS